MHTAAGQHGTTVTISAEFHDLLVANDLADFEAVMSCRAGEVMRAVPGRSTVRLRLKSESGSTVSAYLKRYEPHYLSSAGKWLRRIGWPGAEDEASREWRALEELRRAGFNTPTPMALGRQRRGGAVISSFLLTEEIAGGIAAHDYTRTLGPRPRRELTLAIAGLARDFFAAGFAHRDFYLSHIFLVNPEIPARRRLFLIDLQRLFRPRLFPSRWVVKDLGALAYTAQLAGATQSDLMAFYKHCFRRERLQPGDKRLARRIMARVKSLHGRGPKYDVIWDRPGVRPPNV